MTPKNNNLPFLSSLQRVRLWHALLLIVAAVFVVRLFYLQVIRHNHYQIAALNSQFKQYEIPAERGVIEAYNGDQVVPIVLNEKRYTLYADPIYVKDAAAAAQAISSAIGGKQQDYQELLSTPDTRYVVLAEKLDEAKSQKIESLELKGIGTREVPYRTYPQGNLAAQLLGFVNNEGQGKYGVEQALDDVLNGTPGQLKAITDASGVPLAANKDNVNIEPQAGDRVLLTIDIAMQHKLEEILRSELKRSKSEAGSALIMDPSSGAIKAMANYPTYDPAKFSEVQDGARFNNATVSKPLEVGSIMKPLTAAAAMNLGAVNENSRFYDSGQMRIGDSVVSNVEEDGGPGMKGVQDTLQLSLNTGAAWLLSQMGGGEINSQARGRWHDYMVNKYGFSKLTGIEQGYEASGFVPDPNDGFGLGITYANTSFGQGMTATPLQMAAAISSVVNGGTYYQPRLIAKTYNNDGEKIYHPKVINDAVVSEAVGKKIKGMMEYTYGRNRIGYGSTRDLPNYSIGGKTGTAEIARPEGGYFENVFNGTYMGFLGGQEAEYVIVVVAEKPKIPGYAGAKAAAPIFIKLTEMLVDNFNVSPKN